MKQGFPITASCFIKDTLYLRLGSTNSAVNKTLDSINQSFVTEEIDNTFWLGIKNQTHDFFTEKKNLWRCSHQTATEFYNDSVDQLIEWNGALRWTHSDEDLHEVAERHNGHATRYPLNDKTTISNIFQPMQPELLKIHQRLKQAFDPESILNPDRLYTGL